MFVCKICDQRFDQIPITAEKLSQTIYRFDDGAVHILSRRRKPEPLTETTEYAPDASNELKE
jgi:hypothetical protein